MAANEGTANNSGYDLIRKTFDLFEGVELWEARGSQDSAPYWVLCIPNGRLQHPDAYAKAISRLSALRNEPALLTLAANYEYDEHLCLVYERSNEWVPLQYLRQEDGTYPLWVMRATAELLESFYRRRLSGHFAGAGAIFVDERRQDVRLAFMGLADIFTARGVMPSGFQGRRSWLDDVYGLGETFSQELESLGDETISRCLSSDPSNRPEYRELLKAMQDYEDFHPQYEEEMVMPLLDSSESTANNSGYDLIRKTLEIFEGIELWEAEDSQDFEPCWVLRIPNRRTQHPDAYSRALSRLSALRNQPSLLPWVADYEEGGHLCLVYEGNEEWVPLEHLRQEGGTCPLWVMRATAELLENFYRRRLSGHFAGAGAIFVDERRHEVRLAFMGLADIFTALEVMPQGFQGRRSWLDDVYELGQIFSQELAGLGDETISSCLSPNPSERPEYRELLKAMRNHEGFHPQYRDVIPLSFMKGEKPPAHEEIEELLHCLNTNDCFTTPWEVNEKEK
ncbi:MAG: hypothetical protein ISN29_04510 [Gammaproteobacteria bacterium AqS3]|nr:hypothetical protein [Gammaproteobacteria bacterium AqS3]